VCSLSHWERAGVMASNVLGSYGEGLIFQHDSGCRIAFDSARDIHAITAILSQREREQTICFATHRGCNNYPSQSLDQHIDN
jgi:hypothetical protein